MKKTLRKILLFIGITFLILLFNKVDAATYSVTPSKTNIQVGESINVTVSTNAGAWGLNISGGGLSSNDTSGLVGQTNTTSNVNASKTYTFTANKAGTYTIAVSGDITDYDTDQITKVSKNITINVTEKPTQPTQPAQQTPEPAKPAEPSFSNVNQTVYAVNEGINVRSSYSTSSSVVGSLKKGDSVQRIGIGSNGWSKVSYNGQTAYIMSSLLTTTKPVVEEPKEEPKQEDKKEETSSNKALKDLVVEDYKLTPDFDSENTKYSLTIKSEDDKLNIKATPQDENAKVEITGNENITVGNTIVKITVTAPDGTARIYTIAVSKSNEEPEKEMLKLSSLKVNGATLSPEFSRDVTNYEITVDDPTTIKSENIVAVPVDTGVEVTVAEESKTENGEKVITIMLENEDGTKTGVYQIAVKKTPTNPIVAIQNNSNDNNKIYYILGGIIGALLLLIIVIAIVLKRTSNEEDDEMMDEDELSDDYDYSLKNAIDEASKNEDVESENEISSSFENEIDSNIENKIDDVAQENSGESQILNPTDYNVFKDADGEVGVDNNDDDYVPDSKARKKGKHF